MCHTEAVQSCDSDYNSSGGELIIKIPKAAYDSLGTFGEGLADSLHTHSVYLCSIHCHSQLLF